MFYRKPFANSRSVRLRERVKLNVGDVFADSDNLSESVRGLVSLGKFVQIYCPKPVKKVVCRRGERLYVLCDDGVYYLENGKLTPLYQKAISDVCFTRYGDNVVFSAEKEGVWAQTNDAAKRLTPGGYRSMLTAQTRIFGLNDSGLWITPVDPVEEWTGTFGISLPTACGALAEVADTVYMLGNDCYAYDGKEYAVDSKLYPVARNVGAVQKDSAVSVARKAVFATDKGLFCIAGKVSELCPELSGSLCFEGAVACAMHGKYLVSCRRERGGASNDVTLLVDAAKGALAGVFGCGFESLFNCDNDVYACRDGVLYAFSSGGGQSVFKKQNIDMGSQKMKFLDALVLRSTHNCEVRVYSDGIARSYFFAGSRATRHIPVTGNGREFAVEVRAEDGFCLELLELYAHVRRED